KRNFVTYTCSNAGTTQSSCSNSQSTRLVESCNYGCSNGVCNNPNIVCSSDSQCNDNNPLTYDQCINPGTAASSCRNTEVNCASDLDCGFTGFLGENYCSINLVVKNYQTSICSNAGTLNSYCSLTLNQRTINECQYSCSNGACIRCDSDSNCDDNNSNTFDRCINPRTRESYCRNEEIADINLNCSEEQKFSILLNTLNYQWEDVHNPIESCRQCDHSDSLTKKVYIPECINKVVLKDYIFNDGGDVFVNGVSLRENAGVNTDCNYMAENTRCSTEQEGISCRKVDGNSDVTRFIKTGVNEIKIEYCDKSGPAHVGFVHTYFTANT
ncbi:MAG: hypothetical protein WC584_05400, partial [Candidatus Pacearchaeota archaeon]